MASAHAMSLSCELRQGQLPPSSHTKAAVLECKFWFTC